jgi:shikimate kinase
LSRIFLIGPRGSGKSTAAELLAGRLGWGWVDADAEVERRAGTSIRAIFAAEGEAGFRDRESAVLAELCRRERHVIATGGGVVLREENRRLLRQGVVVWLTADVDTLYRRMSDDAGTAERRPALGVGGRAEVEQIVAAREPLYRSCADYTVDTAGKTAAQVVDEVLTLLAGRG